ncbi:DUF6492 family protein [Actinokineospora sp.]|uniref:DUF6492 family protein n=1 Tax=Actinokineospora sp. TaxID=1872133 RepID=UPI003D6B0210
MTELAVVTPSYAPDVDLFAELHRSVLRHTGDRVTHHVIVADIDRGLFARFAGPRCRLWTASELLPRRYLPLPRSGMRINARRPWPPVRGWVMQQALKIATTAALDAEVVLMADSDVVLVRDITAATFVTEGRLQLYRLPAAVHEGMADHIRWHHVARSLLGLPPDQELPLPDYVSALNVWSPGVVRAMQRQVEEVTGRSWIDAFTRRLQISEFILYGVFVDKIAMADERALPGNSTICHNYWDTQPLDSARALAFADQLGDDAVGMMISAKSNTPRDIRHSAIQRCVEAAGGDHSLGR